MLRMHDVLVPPELWSLQVVRAFPNWRILFQSCEYFVGVPNRCGLRSLRCTHPARSSYSLINPFCKKGRLAPYKLNDCSKTISSADCQDDACDGNATAALLTVYEPSGQSRAPARPGAKRDPLKRL